MPTRRTLTGHCLLDSCEYPSRSISRCIVAPAAAKEAFEPRSHATILGHTAPQPLLLHVACNVCMGNMCMRMCIVDHIPK